MNHHNANRKFGRKRNVRNGLMRSLAVSLVRDEAIVTTEAKAKELRPMIEKLVTKAQANTVASQRYISAQLGNQPEMAKKLVTTIAPQYVGRAGGYTRITKLPHRKGDAASMAHIEFVK